MPFEPPSGKSFCEHCGREIDPMAYLGLCLGCKEFMKAKYREDTRCEDDEEQCHDQAEA